MMMMTQLFLKQWIQTPFLHRRLHKEISTVNTWDHIKDYADIEEL